MTQLLRVRMPSLLVTCGWLLVVHAAVHHRGPTHEAPSSESKTVTAGMQAVTCKVLQRPQHLLDTMGCLQMEIVLGAMACLQIERQMLWGTGAELQPGCL